MTKSWGKFKNTLRDFLQCFLLRSDIRLRGILFLIKAQPPSHTPVGNRVKGLLIEASLPSIETQMFRKASENPIFSDEDHGLFSAIVHSF